MTMTEDHLKLDDWSADERSVTVEINGRQFSIRPVSFDDAIAVNEQLATDVEASTDMEAVIERSDAYIITMTARLRFEGLFPDFVQRWRLRRQLMRLPGPRRLIATSRLIGLFTDALRSQVAAVQAVLPEGLEVG